MKGKSSRDCPQGESVVTESAFGLTKTVKDDLELIG